MHTTFAADRPLPGSGILPSMDNFDAWFTALPGHRALLWRGALLLTHPDLPPAIVNLSTGDMIEVQGRLAGDVQRIAQDLTAAPPRPPAG